MDPHHLARMLSSSRVAVGCLLTIAPTAVGRVWFGHGSTESAARVAIRALGIRDVALGVATLKALDNGRDPASLLVWGIACDSVDGLATIGAVRNLPGGRVAAALSVVVAAVVAGAVAKSGLRRCADGRTDQ